MKKKILVVDDTSINIEIILELLDDDYNVMAAIDGKTALEIAKEDKPDLILLDILMPIMDGYEICKILKSQESTKNIPIMFITSKTDENSIEKAYDVGGIDFITKPFKPKELLAKVSRELKLQKLIFDLEESKKELKRQASVDSMTGLYNRRYFMQVAKEILDITKRSTGEASVIMLDIDNFKNINDTYGHKTGDNVIVVLSHKLQELTRSSDVISRWGGEEFVILLPETNLDGATVIAEKIRDFIELLSIKIDEEKYLNITVSIGVAQINCQTDTQIEHTINRADDALYDAKHSGKNKVCIRSTIHSKT